MTNRSTIADIKAKLNDLNVKYPAKMKRAGLLQLLAAAKKPKHFQTSTNKVPRGKGMKAILFEMYSADPQLALSREQLMEALPNRKWESIAVWLGAGGLGSKKHGQKVDGVVHPMLIKKDDNGLYRRADV